ncbi:MAG: DUF3828 domain-containing protein [Xanthobacteraceae bacterium]
MIARRNILIGICIGIAFTTAAARAVEPSAKSFVEAIYDHYKGKDANGISLANDKEIRGYFEPKLAVLIVKDRKAARGEVGKLDSDPFIDAQDWEIDRVDVAVRNIAADKASATVAFKNAGKPRTVILDLVKLKGGWRIAEITWDGKATLRGRLTGE